MSESDAPVLSGKHARSEANPLLRRWLALFLVAVSLAAAYCILSRDIGWEARGAASRRKAVAAVHNGNFQAAAAQFRSALADNPYDWESHLGLADLLARRRHDTDGALKHYTLAMAYAPEPSLVEDAREKAGIIRLIRSGELENPREAIEDMFLAVELGARRLFDSRLSLSLRPDADAFWKAWNRRGRGVITNMDILNTHDGFYDAVLELTFPDETLLSMHLRAPLRDIWLFDVSFP